MDVSWNNKRIPVVEQCDIAVIGAGPGGLGASLMAARMGCRTSVFEASGRPGGAAALAEVSPFMYSGNGKEFFDAPIFTEWLREIISYLPEKQRRHYAGIPGNESSSRLITPALAALAAEDLLLEAEVGLFYHFTLVDVILSEDKRKIKYAVLHSKSGFSAASAKVFIDSTGDGDLAALAGCPFDMGDEQGGCQPMTTCFDMGDVDILGGDVRNRDFQEVVQRHYQDAVKDGKLSCQRENLLCFNAHDPHGVHFNTTRILGKDATNGQMRSEAEVIGRRQIREFVHFLRKSMPGFEQATLRSFGDAGVRESRRFRGLARLTRNDLLHARHFADGIARCNYGIDIHNPRGRGTEILHFSESAFYEIPFGCLVPQNVENLLIGSRCISGDVAAHSSFRVMPTVCSIGQGAGVAAALAIDQGVAIPEIDGRNVRRELIRLGARLA